MALSVTIRQVSNRPVRMGMHGGQGVLTGYFTTDTSYPTGGWELDFSSYFEVVEDVHVGGFGGYVLQYDYTNKKVFAYEAGVDAAALDEVGSGGNIQSALGTIRFSVIGRVQM